MGHVSPVKIHNHTHMHTHTLTQTHVHSLPNKRKPDFTQTRRSKTCREKRRRKIFTSAPEAGHTMNFLMYLTLLGLLLFLLKSCRVDERERERVEKSSSSTSKI